jgi:hypothetical protein
LEIQIDSHTLERAQERGTDQHEIRDVVSNGALLPARSGRTAKFKVNRFEQERLGKYYEQKRVEVIFVMEDDRAVAVTVYVFYGHWEV